MYKCKCGKEFEKKQSYVAHCGHCKVNLGRDPKDRFGESRAWSKGKTKYTDDRIFKICEKNKQHPGNFLGHRHSEDTKKLMSEKARYNAMNHINGWKSGDSHSQNKYEEFVSEYLLFHGVNFESEVNIPQSLLGKKGSYYQLDFLVNGCIDLEIDGSSHSVEYDVVRDYHVSNLYKVYRIQHHDSLEELELELGKFLTFINADL